MKSLVPQKQNLEEHSEQPKFEFHWNPVDSESKRCNILIETAIFGNHFASAPAAFCGQDKIMGKFDTLIGVCVLLTLAASVGLLSTQKLYCTALWSIILLILLFWVAVSN